MECYAGRDQAISTHYEKLLQAGAVNEEFEMFGCGYLETGQVKFVVTGKEQTIFERFMKCAQNGWYCTPIEVNTYWSKVAHGERQRVKRAYQFDMLHVLNEKYSDTFFACVERLQNLSAYDYAAHSLETWKETLDACYDYDLLRLFEATVSMAINMKTLTKETGRRYLTWVEQLEKQWLAEQLLPLGEEHRYFGFGYIDEQGQKTFKIFNRQYTAWCQQQKLLLEQACVSPIFSKEYYFDAVDYHFIQTSKQAFETCMKTYMDEHYFALLKELHALPPIVQKATLPSVRGLHQEEQMAYKQFCAQLRIV